MNTRVAVPPYLSKMSRTGPVITVRFSQLVSTKHTYTHQAVRQGQQSKTHL